MMRLQISNFYTALNLAKFVGQLSTCFTSERTRHVFMKHGCPWRQQSQNMAKISKSYILTPPHLQGQVMSVKCEEPMNLYSNFGYFIIPQTLNIALCLLAGQNNRQTDRQTDRQMEMSPADLSGQEHKKLPWSYHLVPWCNCLPPLE